MSLALFDFDGTITTRETMPDFVRRSVSRRRLLVGQLLLAPLVLGYKIGILSGTLIRRVIVRFAYSGILASVPEAQGRDFDAYGAEEKKRRNQTILAAKEKNPYGGVLGKCVSTTPCRSQCHAVLFRRLLDANLSKIWHKLS